MTTPRPASPPAGMEFYHDDSCGERVVYRENTMSGGVVGLFCPRCNFAPDFQSIAMRPVGSTRGMRCTCVASTSPRLGNGEKEHSTTCPRRCLEEFEASVCVRPLGHTGSHWDGTPEPSAIGWDEIIVCECGVSHRRDQHAEHLEGLQHKRWDGTLSFEDWARVWSTTSADGLVIALHCWKVFCCSWPGIFYCVMFGRE